MPLKAIIEPADRSMPPAMMTTRAPRAKMPKSAVLRAMSRELVARPFEIAVVAIERGGGRHHDQNCRDQSPFVRKRSRSAASVHSKENS